MTTVDIPITSPGVYDLPVDVYHQDPVAGGSLSSTGARKLLPPGCPAKYRWWADHPQPPKREFDLGHAAHVEVLGAGQEIVPLDFDNYRTKAAQEARDTAYDASHTPVLRHELAQTKAMAAALRAHPFAGSLFQPGTGHPERTLIWRDADTGVWCRALLDWLQTTGGRFLLRDYKTAHTASPMRLDRVVDDHGYHVQLAMHLMGARALGLAGDDAEALLVMQEKEPPFLVTVVPLAEDAMRIGHAKARRALEVYAECVASGEWPGYADDVVYVSLPPWSINRDTEEYAL